MGRPRLLTENQVVAAIRTYIARRDMPPTIQELKVALRVGSNRTVLRYLARLEDTGRLRRWPGARGMRLTRNGSRRRTEGRK